MIYRRMLYQFTLCKLYQMLYFNFNLQGSLLSDGDLKCNLLKKKQDCYSRSRILLKILQNVMLCLSLNTKIGGSNKRK
jgi:hypothetical protein